MKKKKFERILTFLITSFLLATALASGTVEESATISGYHAPLYTSILRDYMIGGDSINLIDVSLLVEEDIFADKMISTRRVGVNVAQSEMDKRLKINLVGEDDSVRIDRASGSGSLISFKPGSNELNIRFDNNKYFFETSSNKNINLNPSGNVGINIGTNEPVVPLHVGGNAIIRGTLDMDDNKVRRVVSPEDDTDAVNLIFAHQSFTDMDGSKWTKSNQGDYIYYYSGDVITQNQNLGVGPNPAEGEALLVGGDVKIGGTDAYFHQSNRGQDRVIEFQNAENVKCELTIKGGLIIGHECEDKLLGGHHSREDCTRAGGTVHTISGGTLSGADVCLFGVASEEFFASVYYCDDIGWTNTEYYETETVTCTGDTDIYNCEGSSVTISGFSFSRQQPTREVYHDGHCFEEDDYGTHCEDCDHSSTIRWCDSDVILTACY